jgi:hypothetical protein
VVKKLGYSQFVGSMAGQSSAADRGDPFFGPKLQRRKFILCFDGTGNKFQGNEGDSNSRCNALNQEELELTQAVLKIYSMLDKTDGAQCKSS